MASIFTLTLNAQNQDLQVGDPVIGDNLTGTPGTDIIQGLGGNDTLAGLEGDDFLDAGTGNDSLDGGAGDDLLISGDDNYNPYIAFNFASNTAAAITSAIDDPRDRQFGIDEWYDILNVPQTADPGTDLAIVGGTGNDTAVIDFSFGGTAINFTFQPGVDTTLPNGVTAISGLESIWLKGTALNDTLQGGGNDDRLYGFFGNDVLRGGGGNDFVGGGGGTDSMFGGGGDDFIAATTAYAEFVRPGGIQAFTYQKGAIGTIFAGGLVSELNEVIDGGEGTDTAFISFLGLGTPVNFALDPTQSVALPGLNTQITSIEQIWVIDTGVAGDNISGGDLNDRFVSFDGQSDTFNGLGGIDTYEVGITSAVVNLANNAFNQGGAFGDILLNIENVSGSIVNDTLIGDGQDNLLEGGGGSDSLDGGAGDDTLEGSDLFGAGLPDTLIGGQGRDAVSYANGAPFPGSEALRLIVDLLNPGSNTGDAFGDTFFGIEDIIGSRRGDVLRGDNLAAGNQIDGGLGQDTVLGRGGNDTIIASGGNDSLDGGSETDLLILSGNRSDYTIVTAPGGFTITDNRGASFDGTDFVTAFENFQFADQNRTAADLINAAPTTPTLSANSVSENVAIGTVVGTLASTDADGDPLNFSELPDINGSSLFNVVGNQIVTAAAIDFETLASQSITVRVSDGKGGTANQTFNISVLNVNEAPSDLQLSNARIDENSAGQAIGTLTVSDVDTSSGFIFTVLGPDANLFEVDGTTLRVKNGVELDFEAGATRNITIRVSDGDNSIDRNFVIQLNDVLEPIVGDGDSERLVGSNTDDDTILGNGGNDTLVGLGGGDRLDGGSGTDTVEYTQAVRLDLADSDNNSGQADGDTFVSIERFFFSNRADVAAGDNRANFFLGNGGADRLSGLGGRDTLNGGDGNDTLSGGDGNDSLTGAAGADRLVGGEGADTTAGGTGDDTYVVDNVRDVVREAARGGTDTVSSSVDFTLSRNVENLILTGSSAIRGTGNDSANEITGTGRANALNGRGGADEISGGGGNDTITGGAGADTMDGGSGRDTFVFSGAFGRDVIENFQGGRGLGDVLLFDDRLFDSDGDVLRAARQVGDDVVIRFNAQNTITLEDTVLGTLRGDDFNFF